MSGITLNKPESAETKKLFPAEKEKLEKKRIMTKLIISILISNIMSYTLFSFLSSSDDNCVAGNTTFLHPSFVKMVLPATIMTPIDPGQSEYKISIHDEKNQQLIETAYLHPESNGEQFGKCNDDGRTLITVEIPSNMIHLIRPGAITFFIYPFHEKGSPSFSGDKYELVF